MEDEIKNSLPSNNHSIIEKQSKECNLKDKNPIILPDKSKILSPNKNSKDIDQNNLSIYNEQSLDIKPSSPISSDKGNNYSHRI